MTRCGDTSLGLVEMLRLFLEGVELIEILWNVASPTVAARLIAVPAPQQGLLRDFSTKLGSNII